MYTKPSKAHSSFLNAIYSCVLLLILMANTAHAQSSRGDRLLAPEFIIDRNRGKKVQKTIPNKESTETLGSQETPSNESEELIEQEAQTQNTNTPNNLLVNQGGDASVNSPPKQDEIEIIEEEANDADTISTELRDESENKSDTETASNTDTINTEIIEENEIISNAEDEKQEIYLGLLQEALPDRDKSKNNYISYIRKKNPNIDSSIPLEKIVQYYIEESSIETINTDIAIAQMLVATNFLKNTKPLDYNNPVALGNNNENNWNIAQFESLQLGIRAHIQHIKGYASSAPLIKEEIDPRYKTLQKRGYLGTAITLTDMVNKWYYKPIDTDTAPGPVYYRLYDILQEYSSFINQ